MTTSGITNINAKLIHQHPDNPRKDLSDLTELSESIKKTPVSCGSVPCRDNQKSTQFTGMVSVFKRKSRSKRGGVIW